MLKLQPTQQISQISDLYTYFVKHSFKKIALLKITDKKNYQFIGCIDKTKLLRWYNQPYSTKTPSFNSVAQKLLDKTTLPDFIASLEESLKKSLEGVSQQKKFSPLVMGQDKKKKKIFYFEETLISDFLIRFKIIDSTTYSPNDLNLKKYLDLHAFPIIIVNRNRDIIYLNQKATKIKKYLFPSKKINGIKTKKETLFHNPLDQPLNGKLETTKMSGHYAMQSLLHENGLTFMITFFKVMVK